MSATSVTLGQLLAMGLLADYHVLGGATGLDRPVRMVVPGASVHAVADLAPGSVVVFGAEQLALDELDADLVIRLGHSGGLAGLIVERAPGPVPLVTSRLADKLAFPLVGVQGVAPAAIAATFDPYVRAPEIAGLRILGTTAQRLQNPPTSAAALTATLSQTIGGRVVLVDAEHRYVAGDQDTHALLAEPRVRAPLAESGGRTVPNTVALGVAEALLVHPVRLAADGAAHYWLIARLATAAGPLLEPLRQALAVAALSFAVLVAGHTAALERESRTRALLLAEILDHADAPSPRAVQRAAALGWRLAGWHTAVQVAVREAPSGVRQAELAAELEDRLAEAGLAVRLVERPDGWAFWTTAQSESAGLSPDRLGAQVGAALAAVREPYPEVTLCAGVGGAHPGAEGIERSLGEARKACLLARTEHGAQVEHVDAVSMKRLLVGWYGAGALRSVAAETLEPLLAADPSGELLRTLRQYLDRESSVTDTAAGLGVHRNTVMQRLERIRALLPVDLTDPDNRIVVHLATRAVGVDW